MLTYIVIASAVISSTWIGSVHDKWNIPAPLLYLNPPAIHAAVFGAVWTTARSTDLAHRRFVRRKVYALIAIIAVVAADATWARLDHFDLPAGLVMAMICSLGPLMLTMSLLGDPHPVIDRRPSADRAAG